MAGLRVLDAHDIASLKTGLSQTAIRVDNDADAFQDFYQFAFKFCLTVSLASNRVRKTTCQVLILSADLQEPRQKIIDIDTTVQMLSIVMTNQPHLQPFCHFLQQQTEYKFINNDQWMGFFRFNEEVGLQMSWHYINFASSSTMPKFMNQFRKSSCAVHSMMYMYSSICTGSTRLQ